MYSSELSHRERVSAASRSFPRAFLHRRIYERKRIKSLHTSNFRAELMGNNAKSAPMRWINYCRTVRSRLSRAEKLCINRHRLLATKRVRARRSDRGIRAARRSYKGFGGGGKKVRARSARLQSRESRRTPSRWRSKYKTPIGKKY